MTLPILIVSNIQLKLMLTVAMNKETKGTTYKSKLTFFIYITTFIKEVIHIMFGI